MKDPFEAAVEEQESPPESPAQPEEDASAAPPHAVAEDYDGGEAAGGPRALPPRPRPSSLAAPSTSAAPPAAKAKAQAHKEQDDEDEEEDQMEVDIDKLPSGTSDPDKLAKMKSVSSVLFARPSFCVYIYGASNSFTFFPHS
jgi:transcription initiation factor TFIID subunit 11